MSVKIIKSHILLVVVLCGSVGFAQDWGDVPLINHSTYQEVDGSGASVYSGGFPVRLQGVVLNNTEDWLDPTADYDPGMHLWEMGGQAEIFVQGIVPGDSGGTA